MKERFRERRTGCSFGLGSASTPSSLYAHCFDVDWSHPDDRMGNRVVVPILGDHYGRVLRCGLIRLERSGAEFTLRSLPA